MKKVKLCIAGLLLSGISYGQCTTNPVDEECKLIQYGAMHLIDSVREDVYYGRISKRVADYYLEELLRIQRNAISLVNIINQSQLAFDEEVSDYLQETLTMEEWSELEAKINE